MKRRTRAERDREMVAKAGPWTSNGSISNAEQRTPNCYYANDALVRIANRIVREERRKRKR